MELSERFDQALVMANHLHRQQRRKGTGTPYVGHLLAVSSLVLECGGDEDTAIAALLHDAVEDQGGQATLAAIREQFGPRVADLVEACSDSDDHPKPPWRGRKEAYLAHLEHADEATRLISCADKVHNARCILRDYLELGEELWPRFRGGGREGSLWYYRAMAEVFGRLGPRRLAVELDELVTRIEGLADGGGPVAE
ncbi:MAG: HD domain-containing protein [Armatimonadetes bacterium]|nr:HD domain-containing protein [Armatimonadota bacterium]